MCTLPIASPGAFCFWKFPISLSAITAAYPGRNVGALTGVGDGLGVGDPAGTIAGVADGRASTGGRGLVGARGVGVGIGGGVTGELVGNGVAYNCDGPVGAFGTVGLPDGAGVGVTWAMTWASDEQLSARAGAGTASASAVAGTTLARTATRLNAASALRTKATPGRRRRK